MVDAPRLVSSDGRPTRPECAVTRHSTPAACAAAVNLNPIVCADNGTTRPAGSGFVTARSVRMARATPAFTNRPSFVSPSWFVLLLRTVTSTPSPSGGVDHVGPAQRAHLAAPHPRHETAIQRSPHRDGPRSKAVFTRKNAGLDVPAEFLAHVPPLGWEHINLTGEYRWPSAGPRLT